MGVEVQEVVERYTTCLADTDTPLRKEVVESAGGRHDLKRRLSEVVPGNPRADSPLLSPDSPTSDSDDSMTGKRARIESPASPSTYMDSSINKETYESRRSRFLRTAQALRKSGLLNITMKTADLLRKNQELQQEIENLQQDTKNFVLSVLSNPENRHILDNIRSGAQLYEIVVPGSQGIMSVTRPYPDDTTPEPSTTTPSTTSYTLLRESPSSSPYLSPSSSPSSSPSPAPSSSSDFDPSSLSEDSDSSQEENLAPPKLYSSAPAAKTKH